ncbi:MAG: hypothetical protein PHS19_07015 [Eubacteriales bacterium]|nr:hypothetical protein [Eubacteriales bacterium]
MSFKNNGHKRDPRFLAGALGMLFVAALLFYLAFTGSGLSSWEGITGIIILLLSILMIKNANEM